MCKQLRTDLCSTKNRKKILSLFLIRPFVAQSKLDIVLFCILEIACLEALKSVAKGIFIARIKVKNIRNEGISSLSLAIKIGDLI